MASSGWTGRVLLCAAASAALARVLPRTAAEMQPAAAPAGALLWVALIAVAAGPLEAQSGSIEGRLEAPQAAVRRVADRYLTGAGAAPRTVQQVPAVAWLDGTGTGDAPARGSVRIAQRDTTFVPAVAVVAPGSTVEFPNQDPFFHNVFSYSAVKRFDLGRYPRGESKAVRFDQPGVVKVYCEVHEFMRAAVIVTPTRFHTVVQPDGSFRLTDVPPGSYTLVVWHPDHMERIPVVVQPGRASRVTVRAGGRGGSGP